MNLKKKFVLLLLGFSFFMTGCRDTEAEIFTEEEISSAQKEEDEKYQISQAPQKEQEQKPQDIYVDVCGAVKKPGVYRLKAGARIYEAIEKAGGFSEEAQPRSVNQAQPVSDGEQITVLTKEEAKEGTSARESAGSGQNPAQAADGRVNINTADETQLQTLSGIGQARARAIIEYREKNGDFSAIEEIMEVEGIKEGIFEKIKDEIVVG